MSLSKCAPTRVPIDKLLREAIFLRETGRIVYVRVGRHYPEHLGKYPLDDSDFLYPVKVIDNIHSHCWFWLVCCYFRINSVATYLKYTMDPYSPSDHSGISYSPTLGPQTSYDYPSATAPATSATNVGSQNNISLESINKLLTKLQCNVRPAMPFAPVAPVALVEQIHPSYLSFVGHYYPTLNNDTKNLELCPGLNIIEEVFCDSEDFRISKGYSITRICQNPICLFAHSFDDVCENRLLGCKDIMTNPLLCRMSQSCSNIHICSLAHHQHPYASYTIETNHRHSRAIAIDKYKWRQDRYNRWVSRRSLLIQYQQQLQQQQRPLQQQFSNHTMLEHMY